MSSHITTKQSQFVTSREASELTGVASARTFQRWAKAGKVRSIVLPSGRRVFRRADIEAILEPKEVSAGVDEVDRMVDQPLPGLEGVA